MIGASEQHKSYVYNQWIEFTVCVLGLNMNLFHIMRNNPNVVGILHSGYNYECRSYAWFIVIDLCIGSKLF